MDYPEVVKARMIRRMTGPGKQSAMALAAESGISHSTLSRWLQQAGHMQKQTKKDLHANVSDEPHQNNGHPTKSQRPQDVCALDRARAVLDAEGLTGEALGAFLRQSGFHKTQIEQWRVMLEEAMSAAPRRRMGESKQIKQLERELSRKDAALAEAAALIVLKKKSGEAIRVGRGSKHSQKDRELAMTLITEATGSGARLAPACRVLGLSVRTLQRWYKRPDGSDLRCGPKSMPSNAFSEAEWARVRAFATAPEFVDLSPHQLVAKLADMGIYVASERSFYRELKRAKLLRHRDRSKPRTCKKPCERIATGPNQTWAWDITYLPGPVVGSYFFLYAILDVWSRKLVAYAVHDYQNDTLSSQLAEHACRQENVLPGQLLLHADNGSAMKGKTMVAKLEQLGVMPSFSRPRVSDDNPFPESFFRTLKYRSTYPDRRFRTAEEAKTWVDIFVDWYNNDHQHSSIRFVTPAERHDGREKKILTNRHSVYLAARKRHPNRWSTATRNWSPLREVTLHPARPRHFQKADKMNHLIQAA